MTPRVRITWLDAAAELDENLTVMRAHPFSRYPVYRGSDSEVLGVMEVKTLLDRIGETDPDLFGELREALFVSESTHALKLLEIFREEQQSFALVVDEYGDVSGVVTVNDLMGAVMGRIYDVSLSPEDDMRGTGSRAEDGSYFLDGALPVENCGSSSAVAACPARRNDFHTTAGMVIAFGRIPHVGENFGWNGWRIEVVDLDGPRIDKLLLQRDAAGKDDDDDSAG
jgi:putative hemolysin